MTYSIFCAPWDLDLDSKVLENVIRKGYSYIRYYWRDVCICEKKTLFKNCLYLSISSTRARPKFPSPYCFLLEQLCLTAQMIAFCPWSSEVSQPAYSFLLSCEQQKSPRPKNHFFPKSNWHCNLSQEASRSEIYDSFSKKENSHSWKRKNFTQNCTFLSNFLLLLMQ